MNYINLVEDTKEAQSIGEIPRNINQVYIRTKDEYADALVNRLKSNYHLLNALCISLYFLKVILLDQSILVLIL